MRDPPDLQLKHRVALDLLRRGASEVIISDEQLLVRRLSANPETAPSPMHGSVIVNVSAIANAQAVVSARSEITMIRRTLIRKYPKRAGEIRRQFDELQSELEAQPPKKRPLRRFLKWAADLDWQTFSRLSKIIIEMAGSAG